MEEEEEEDKAAAVTKKDIFAVIPVFFCGFEHLYNWVCSSIRRSVRRSVSPSVRPSVHPSAHPSVDPLRLFICGGIDVLFSTAWSAFAHGKGGMPQ